MLVPVYPAPSNKSTRTMKTLKISKPFPGYVNVIIDNPPLNLMDQQMLDDLQALTAQLEQDTEVKIVVFESANPDFFMPHLDIAHLELLNLEPMPATGLLAWPDVALRLERAPFTTIAKIRGRARGVGSEFVLAMDMRFASTEKALLAQIEIGCGAFPGGGGIERLPKLIGRARALEVILSGQDYNADIAERYGWVNRSVPDAELDGFVENLASRIASFDAKPLAQAKTIVNERIVLPVVEELASTERKFFEALGYPETQARIQSLFERGLQTHDFEYNLADNIYITKQ